MSARTPVAQSARTIHGACAGSPREPDQGGGRRDDPRPRAESGHHEELERGEGDVLIGKPAGACDVEDVVVHHRVPGEARRGEGDRRIPGEAQDQERRHARPGQPRAERPRAAGGGKRQADGDRRQQRAEGVFGECGETEHGQPERGEAAVAGEDGRKKQREAADQPGDEERLGAHIAAVGEEATRGQEGDAGEESPRAAVQPGPQPGRRRHRDERAEGGDRTRRPLAGAADGKRAGQQQVEQRGLVHVTDAVESEPERIAAGRQLARDLRVHPLAGVVERRAAEAGEEKRRRQRRGERGRRQRAARLQVRDTRKTPSTMKPMPVQRSGVTGSASMSCARRATMM